LNKNLKIVEKSSKYAKGPEILSDEAPPEI
jgi:hypothetical protein